MRLYDWEEIKNRADCLEIATNILGLNVRDGRCPAVWRGGTNPSSVAINDRGFFDHGNKGGDNASGSVIDLVALCKFGGNVLQAQEFLGEYLNISNYNTPGPDPATKYSRLLRDGFREVERYPYTDEVGNLVYQVIRLEHPTKPKEFLQCDANGKWSVKHIQPVPYNLPKLANTPDVFVVEGEKDANTLATYGIVATTNSGGSEKWPASFAQYFKGKNVAVLYDNDLVIPPGKTEPVGLSHAKIVAATLIKSAASVRILKTSSKPKGDVTDYLADGGTISGLFAMVQATAPLSASEVADVNIPQDDQTELNAARQANKIELRNFVPVNKTVNGKVHVEKEPRQINDLIEDCHRRFMGFPRKVGEQLFDHDRANGSIFFIRNKSSLFSWINRKSKQRTNWARGDSLTSKDEFYEGILAEALRYESISKVPDWPLRSDVYYSHEPLPEADQQFKYFDQLVKFFNPAPGFEVALKAFIAAPLLFKPGIPRPMWIIGSEEPGSGKTTLANIVANLYGNPPIEVKKGQFVRDTQRITERLVSDTGRLARMLLVDNVTGFFASEELSGMITMPYISGKAPYGHGEETRPNNLTYVVTANKATIDNDLAIRSYFIHLKALENYSPTWAGELNSFIEKNRLNIFADIIKILDTHRPFADTAPTTRCPEFEVKILQAFCENDIGKYSETIKNIISSRTEANAEEEWGKQLEDDVRFELQALGVNPDTHTVFVTSAVAEEWYRKIFPEQHGNASQSIKLLIHSGHCKRFDKKIQVWPSNGSGRRRGFMWLNEIGEKSPTYSITKKGSKIDKVLVS